MQDEGKIENVNCDLCGKRIVNPICMNCRMSQLESWINDHDIQSLVQEEIIDNARKIFPEENGAHLLCVLCKNNVMICMSCFFSKLDDQLQEMEISQEIKNTFPKTFNYNLYLEDTTR